MPTSVNGVETYWEAIGRGRPIVFSHHLGGNAEWLIKPPHNLIANTQTLTLSDRPELRIDPTTLISTSAIAGVSGAQVYSAEAAGTTTVPCAKACNCVRNDADRETGASGILAREVAITGLTCPLTKVSAGQLWICRENVMRNEVRRR